jgi:hypothetical protein
MPCARATQSASHVVVQHVVMNMQTWSSQVPHEAGMGAPVTHGEWEHVPVPEELVLLVVLVVLLAPLQPQPGLASVTHIESHCVAQQ